jgi:hypothetical protein
MNRCMRRYRDSNLAALGKAVASSVALLSLNKAISNPHKATHPGLVPFEMRV